MSFSKQIRRIANSFGFDIMRFTDPAHSLASENAHLKMMREIRSNDAVEIEEMYRKFVFSDLPRRQGRKELLNGLIGTSIGEAIYIIRYLHLALQLPGDICEFGVAQGATSRLMGAEILDMPERNLWLFDSFQGLPAPTEKDRLINDIFDLGSMYAYKGTMTVPEIEVREKLRSIGFSEQRTKLKAGWIKDTIKAGDLPTHICFAYVDFDFYEPILDALRFISSRMPIGGHIIVDDYGWFSEGAQLAVDEFVAEAGEFKFELPIPFAGHFCILSKVSQPG